MASGLTEDLCDICEAVQKVVHAVKWCPECEEKLCEDCLTRHSVSKLLKHHKVIDIEHYRQLPDSTLEVKSFCEQHEMKYTNLCGQHDQLCCPACLSSSGPHSRCTELSLLVDVVKTAKTSTLMEFVDSSLNNLKSNLQMIIDFQTTNIQELLEQKAKLKERVNNFKEKIKIHLDKIEKQILEDLDKKVTNNSVCVENQKTKLEHKLEKVQQEKQELDAVKQYGSDLQTYITCKRTEKDVSKEISSLADLVKSGNLKQRKIELLGIEKTTDTILNLSSFGMVKEEATTLPIVLKPFYEKQAAQIMLSPVQKSFDSITATLQSRFNITGKLEIQGLCGLYDKTILLADKSSKSIKKLTEDGELSQVISVSSGPWDVTVIDLNTVAVSTDEGVKIINTRTNTEERTINTGKCLGLEYYKGSLFCCAPVKGVLSVDLSNDSITTVVHDKPGFGCYYIAVYNDRIYTTRSWYNKVTCYTIGGDKVWEFNDESVILRPCGITVDSSSNIYIASSNNHSIVVMSPDGQRCRTLLTGGGINNPIALYVGKPKQQLLVANYSGPVFVFKL